MKWRWSSSWRKAGNAWTRPQTTNETKAEEEWYGRYQAQKKKQYEEFMKKMEEDPIGMLFGSKWASWVDSAEAKMAHPSASTKSQEKRPSPDAGQTSWDRGYAESGSKASLNKDRDHRSEQNEQTKPIKATTGDTIHEHEIDPITNRRVRKVAAPSPKSVEPETPSTKSKPAVAEMSEGRSSQRTQESSDIPIKQFVPPSATSPFIRRTSRNVVEITTESNDSLRTSKSRESTGWLAQEGFGQKKERATGVQPPHNNTDERTRPPSSKIESALDRHLQTRNANIQDPDRTKLQYKAQETTTDDVDLLRPSDVRASAGLRGRTMKGNEADKQARQRQLEKAYDDNSSQREMQLAEEIAQNPNLKQTPAMKPKPGLEASATESKDDIEMSIAPEWANEISEPPNAQTYKPVDRMTIATKGSEKANKIRAQIVPLKARLDAMKAEYDALRQHWLDEKRRHEEKVAKRMREIHEEEIKAQKLAMESIETRRIEAKVSNTANSSSGRPESGTSTRRLQSYLPGEGDMASNVHEFASRDRWYKKKAPHAQDEMDAKLQRLANDRALISEVRGIYEDTYGTIDTNHRQLAESPTGDQSLQPGEGASPPTSNQPLSTPGTAASTPPLGIASNESDFSIIIGRLLDALREAQILVQNHRDYLQEVSKPNVSKASSIANCQNDKPVDVYRILAFDSAKGNVTASKPTSIPVLPEGEKPLSPVEALQTLDNPGRFLPYLMILHNHGFTVVSGSEHLLVLKKLADSNAIDVAKPDATSRHVDPISSLSAEKLWGSKENLPLSYGEIRALRDNSQKHDGRSSAGNQQKAEEQQKPQQSSKPENSTSPTSPDSAPAQPSTEDSPPQAPNASATPPPATPSSNLPPSEKVRRKEAVFSGPSHNNWQESERKRSRKYSKHKQQRKGRARRSRLKNVLVTGTVTAGFCYAVGVVSQMLRY